MGTVLVNGQPAGMVRVQFLHNDDTVTGNARMPIGLTGDDGAFSLTTSANKDGAVEGEYTIAFEWLSGNNLGAYDRFGGKFASPKESKFKARVEAKSNTLAPFEITIPESQLVKKPGRGEPR